ncbi:SH3 domain-containing protein [Bacillus anthracis]|uniref:SH3 domain-containing protein n=1 Tax=Bacillus anthracis TaxID=1392 RepID=UPI00099C0034|nr:SH3 domain-containing protein [Bacillus anthracis]OPD54054.1 hypothetical protein BVG01_29305 [Bacillus anthracis]
MKNISMNEAKKTAELKKPIMVLATAALLGTGLFSMESPFTSPKVVHADSETYKVTADVLNVRSSANTNSSKIGRVYQGQSLSVIGKETNGWYKINHNGRTGYVSGEFVRASGGGSVQNSSGYTVTADVLNVRSSTSASSSKIGRVYQGQTLSVIGQESNGWYKINFNGRMGYVSGEFVKGSGAQPPKTDDSASNSGQTVNGTYKVTASALHVRSGSNPGTKSIGFVYKDQTISVMGKETNGWYKVNFNGQTGYVSGAYVQETSNNSNQTKPETPVGKKTIFIDPGHQRKGDLSKERVSPSSNQTKYKVTYGASGVATKKPEYQLTLEASMVLKQELEKRGFHVMMSRTTNDVNVSNIERAQMANNANTSLTVRVHADGSDDNSSVRGFSILTPANTQDTQGIYQESLKASQTILNTMRSNGIQIHGSGIFKRSDMTGFNWSQTPVVLLEMGFMSNPDEDRLLSDPSYQRKLMGLTADAIVKHFQ